jgi:hypothetical protein
MNFLRISSGSLRCHLHFHVLVLTSVGDGSKLTEASEKMDYGPYVLSCCRYEPGTSQRARIANLRFRTPSSEALPTGLTH